MSFDMPTLESDDPTIAALIEEIVAAFDGVPRGEVTLHEALAMDDYADAAGRAEARKLDLETRWQDVPDHVISTSPWALAFLDRQSLRYYMPAYMIWTLQNYRNSDSITTEFTVFHLLEPGSEGRFEELTYPQRNAIARFLRQMVLFGDEVAESALSKYWVRYLK